MEVYKCIVGGTVRNVTRYQFFITGASCVIEFIFESLSDIGDIIRML